MSDQSSTPARRERQADLHRCKCGITWGGHNTAHCGACHETFSTVRNFDKHRVKGACVAPASVGLSRSRAKRAGTAKIWALPGEGYARN